MYRLERGGTKMATSLRLFAFITITIFGLSLAQECAVNQCPGGETCFDRNVDAQPSFVCECDAPTEMGYNCLTPTADIDEIFTCYGSGCETGSFSSPGWPTEVYSSRYGGLYLLYIPGAQRIDFTFNSPFAIESLKDELYVGPGLSFTQSQLDGLTVPNDHYFFEGSNIPAGFSIESDTVWMAFLTDKNVQLTGFQIQWSSFGDETRPTISNCPSNIQTTIPLGTAQTSIQWIEPTAVDDSGVVNIILQTSTPGSNFGVGPTTVTYVFADPTGNTAICSFTVTVIAVDNEKPTITGCPNNIFREIELGTPSTTVVWTEPTAVDNSGSVTLTLRSHSPGSAFAVGSTLVTYEFTDPSSNVEICSFTVTVVTDDNVPPTISNCPSSTFQNIDIGTGGASVVWVEPTATDLSGSVTVTSNRSPGSFFLGGTTTNVEYVFTDPSGNEAICSFSVTIEEVDNQQPTISGCPANINVNVELGTTSATVTWIEPTAVDNSGVVNLITRSHAPNSAFPLGTTPVSYVFTDLSNNIAQCGFDVTVTPVDNTPPTVLNCPGNILRTVELGVTSLPVSWVEPSATDISGVVSLASRSHAPGDSFPIGPTVVSYVFLDSSSNDAPCAFTVTVTTEDTTPPVISDCPVGVVRVVELGTPGAVASWTEPTATDLSGAVTLTQRSHQPNDFFGIGATVVSYTFLDNSGNDASCSFTVNIVMQDTTPPTIDNCPTSFSSITELGTGGTIVNWVEPTATDLSNVANLILRSHEPGTFFTVGTTTVTYRFSDADSNLATCMFDVTVIADDNVPPTIVNCPTGILINVELGETSSQAFWTEPSATDLSGQANLVTRTNQPGDNFPLGPTLVTYVFRDNSGNSDQCQFTVTVGTSDNTPPTIANCPTNIERTVELGSSGLPVSWLEPTATDLSGVVTLSVRSNAPGSTFNLGTTIVNYIFIDSSSNEAMCTFSVTVVPVDTTRPTISNCPANIAEVIEVGTTSAFVSWTEPTATDASGQVFTSRSEAPGNLFPVGPTPVTYTFTDNSNNFAECEFVVTVIQTDTLPPTLQSCPTDLSAITELGTSGTVVVWTEPIATDISGVANLVFQSHQSGNLFVVGETDVIYTFADNTGNSVDCEFTVTVTTEDTQRPTIANCPTNIETTVELGSSGAVANWIEPTATDISGTATLVLRTAEPGSSFSLGDTTVNYIFRDASGNNAICSFSVIVNSVDTTPPAIENCPSNIDVTVELGTPSTPVNWIEPTATDLSGTVTLSQRSHSPGSTFPVGMTVVSYTFTDSGGISAMCSFVVNVIPVDRTPPTISNCPTNIGAVVELGTTSANVQWQEPTATDASNQVSLLIRSHAPGSSFLVGSTTVTYRFGDNANNINDCIFDVIVTTEDTTPPIIQNCPANINSIVELGTPGRLVSWTEPTAFDASGVVNIVLQSHTTNSLFPVGSTIVTYVFSDDSGLTSTCTFTVTIITTDNTPPVISNCPDNILLNIELGITSAIAFWVEPTATDLSGVANIVSQSASPGDAFSLGTTIVNYVFSDGFNSDSCAFNVVVTPVDTQPPVIANCPAPISVVIELGSTGGVAFWTEPTATDFSGTVTLIERTNSPGSVFPVGTTVVRYTFSDNGGNEDFCTFPVTVTTEDTQDPIISNCPANIPVTIELGITQGVASWTEPTATDISGTANLVQRTSSPNSLFPIGSTDVTYTFSDNAGNTAECIFTVTVTTVDTTPPIIQNSPADISRVVEFGVSGIPVSWIEPTAFDLSGVANLVLRSHEPGSVFPVGTTVVTYTFSDASGNPSQTEFTVTVTTEDTVPPTIQNCPSNIGLVVELGITSTSAFWLEPTATDLSGTVNLVTRSHTPGSSFPLGTTGVTYTFTDASNNPSTCSFNVVVSVEDTTPPVVSNCPAPIPITVELGSTEASAQWQEPTATDLSGIVSLAQRSHAPGSSFPLGTTVVTYRFIDNAGNDVDCSFPVTVTPSDTQDPIISNCPANIFVTIELGITRGVASWTEPTATDISGTTTLAQRTSSPDSLFPIGSTDVTYTFSDNSGNTAECTFTVTVSTVDTTPPIIQNSPADISRVVEFGVSGIPVSWIEPTAFDLSGVANLVLRSHEPGSVFPVGTTVVTYTFRDASGNPSQTEFTVTVTTEDTVPPTIQNCPSNIGLVVELGSTSAPAFWLEPTATDLSGTVNLVTRSHTPGSSFPLGTTGVTYTFTDASNNPSTCSFNVVVSVEDTTPPVVSNCPAPIPITVELGSTEASAQWQEPTATDLSGIVSLAQRSNAPGSSFPLGTTVVTYRFIDNAGNDVVCSFPVTVTPSDTQDPIISNCPANIFVTIELGITRGVASWTEPTATDISGTTTLAQRTSSPNSLFPIGSTDVTYTFSDNSGNTAECTFTVTVTTVDTTPPIIQNSPADISRVVEFGVSGIPVSWIEPTAFDLSGVANLVLRSHEPGSVFPVGTTVVTYTFRDASGNPSQTEFTVTVTTEDTVPPTIQNCPSNIGLVVELGSTSASAFWLEPTATDLSGTVNLVTRSHTPGSSFPLGTTGVTYTFTDASNNPSTCSFNVVVSVEDTTPPVVSNCPAPIPITVELGSTEASAQWQEPTATDLSGIVSLAQRSHAPGSSFPLGTTVVTYRFIDNAGNDVDCSFPVTVTPSDTQDPIISNCPANIFVTIELGTTRGVASWTEPTATDISGTTMLAQRTSSPNSLFPIGSTDVTYTFSDNSGNTAECTFTVTVTTVDTTPPTIIQCPSDITAEAIINTGGVIVTWVTPTAVDISGTANIVSQTALSGSLFQVGTTVVRITFVDASGNPADCVFDVIVTEVDPNPPEIFNCPEDITRIIELNEGGVEVFYSPPQATDDSGIVNLVSQSHTPGQFFPTGETIVVYLFSDPTGNNNECRFKVTVTEVDSIIPVIGILPEDITRTVQLGSPGTVVTWPEPQVSDNSGIVNLVSQSHTPGSFFPVGTTEVTYTYADPTNNRVMVSFDVNVIEVDSLIPVIGVSPEDITRTVPIGSPGTVVTWPEPQVSDNSGIVNLVSQSHTSGSFFPVGTTEVTYTYADPSNNRVMVSFDVNVIEVDPCDSGPCQNGAACVVTSTTEFICVCAGNCFTGVFCEIGLSACSSNQCANGAACLPVADSCTQYTCECPACFTGPFCNIELDACVNNQCQNGGQCVQENSCTTYRCECPPCFTGEFCEQGYNACDDNACLNGGVCSNIGGSCSEYTCSCPSCVTGAFCQFSRDSCNPNPCQNNGFCTSSADSSCFAYSCQCIGCFTGFNCEVAIPSGCSTNPCQNGGICSELPGTCGGYSCTCQNSFAGVRCQDPSPINVNPCNSSPCGNGATCLTMDGQYYICVCRPGYFGINCRDLDQGVPNLADPCDVGPCLNGATCRASYNANSSPLGQYVSQYTCICAPGFTGANCQAPTDGLGAALDICNLNTRPGCENGGTCANAYHSFDQDVDYFCFCLSGFTGHNCEATVPDPCASSPCQNNAACTSFSTYYTCSCAFGFSGTTCEIISSGDVTGPTISNCPSNIQVSVPVGSQGVATWPEPFAVDTTGVAELVYQSDTSGSSFPIGTSAVAYVFVDIYRNPSVCLFFVTVTSVQPGDNTPPVITGCPGDVTAFVPADANSAVVTWTEPTATDNSQVQLSLTQSHFPGSQFPLGTTPVSYTFTDASGNLATCSFNVIVTFEFADNVDPVVSNCPSDIVVNIPGGMFGRASWTAPTATDDSGTVTLVSGPAVTTGFFQLGSTPLMYVFEDEAGNQAICSFNVIVTTGTVDNIDPVISNCPQDVVVTANTGASSAPAFWNAPTAMDASGMVTLHSVSASPGDSFPLGSTPVTYIFSDAFGNTAECSFNVIVNAGGSDTTPPTILNCPSSQTITATAGASSAVATWIVPTATDASGIAGVTSSANPGDSFPLGPNVVSYRFTDNANIDAVCEFQILVLSGGGGGDLTAPVISNCPANIQQNLPNGQFAAVSWTAPTAVDESGDVTVVGPGVPSAFFAIGVTTISYIFTDAAGNEAICSFDIIITAATVVDDTTRPVISNCPTDIFRQIPNGAAGDFVSWSEPTATDNLDTSLTIERSHVPGAFFIVGPTLVSYTFTDDAGNSALCSFSVNIFVSGVVVDNTAPVISDCPVSPIEVTISSALDAGLVTWTPEPTAVDESTVTLTQSHLNGAEFPVGDTSVVYSFEDEFGNQANCSFTVTVTRGPNACSGNPCPENTSCFYSQDQFLCLPRSSRRRRDLLSDDAVCPCQNNGTCHHSGEGNYCKCPKGFSGVLCDAVEITMQKEAKPSYSEANLQWSMVTVMGILLLVITVLAFALCTMSNKIMAVSAKQQPDEVAIIH
ncbi:uncharacterized protein [Apostichopus japonicus]|uniref:uncharacterized protein isoform X2 n=1 Tax=Stichopus japonicus TaxID=307972 RepID=UPI003AB48C42